MRVIWVTLNNPDPRATGGSAHEYEILRAVAPHHRIHLISANQQVDPAMSPLHNLGVTVERVTYRTRAHPTGRLSMAWAMLRAEPTLVVWLFRDRLVRLAEAVGRAEVAERADLVHATHGELAPVLRTARAPTALLLFDSYARYKDRQLERESIPRRRLQIRVERRRARRWERRWYRSVDGLAAVSSVDAEFTERFLGRPVDIIPNPIGEEYFEPPARPRDPATVAFVGSLLYPPNIDAITWLTRDIWPAVLARVPGARLEVVGRAEGDTAIVPKMAEELAAVGGTVATDVPDIRPYYWRATAVVAPLRLGTGLRNKVIHAMACEAPVVATPDALEGVGAEPGRDALVASSATEIADRLVEVLTAPDRAAALSQRGLRLAQRFRTPVVAERFEDWWARAAARDARETRA